MADLCEAALRAALKRQRRERRRMFEVLVGGWGKDPRPVVDLRLLPGAYAARAQKRLADRNR